jgi:antitoxin component of MazEF toxin-antitoxin module
MESSDEKSLKESEQSLDELLAQIMPENLHGEIDWGAPVGEEVW